MTLKLTDLIDTQKFDLLDLYRSGVRASLGTETAEVYRNNYFNYKRKYKLDVIEMTEQLHLAKLYYLRKQ